MSPQKRSRLVSTGAPPRTLYRKIQVVLAEVRRTKRRNIDDLIEDIEQHGHLDFTRYYAEPGHATTLVPCSKESMRRVIDICSNLGLVDLEKMRLSTVGLRAADARFFDEVLRESIPVALRKLGTPIQDVRKVCIELLSSGHLETLPTADVIFSALVTNGTSQKAQEEFRTYLSLLGISKGIHFSRKKIYLP